jgi:hypothetical protein
MGFGLPMVADPAVPPGEAWIVVGQRISVRVINLETASTTAGSMSIEAESFGQSSTCLDRPGYAD